MAIFNKGNDALIHQVLRELGELRQQVSDQQHGMDQARQEATAAINDGLREIRSAVRGGLDRGSDNLREPLATISTELVGIRAALNNLNRGRPAAAGPPPAQGNPAPAPAHAEEPAHAHALDGEHVALLRKAAGISAAELEVHRDTWAFLVEHAVQDRHFHIPGAVDEHEGTVTVNVSGLSLVAALTSLRGTQHAPAVEPGTAAIAEHLYDRVADTVRSLSASPRPDAEPVRIVIDDRAAADNDEDQPPQDSDRE
ncbi:hypothetical protein [Streptomyces lasiicapitis]|uniref:hypothetical protein n=1 Tax=Streptomyces lasiicapitis TaxID=1923961 RepID=UPI003655E835